MLTRIQWDRRRVLGTAVFAAASVGLPTIRSTHANQADGITPGTSPSLGLLKQVDAGVLTPYGAIEKEPAPKLIVDPPLPEGLAHGIFWAQYRVGNLRIVSVFGAGAVQTSPRVGASAHNRR